MMRLTAHRSLRRCFLGLLLGLVMGLVPSVAQAASFTVTSTADTANSVNDPTTLRGAIAASQASPDASDTIIIGVVGTVSLTQGELLISNPKNMAGKTVIISGPGAGKFSISGASTTRILHITGGTVDLSGITLTQGVVSTGTAGGAGVLLDSATLSMAHCVVSNCDTHVSNTVGSGIANIGGDLTLSSCLITLNGYNTMLGGNAGAGGIGSQDGSLSLTNCTVNANNGVGQGGGIASFRETCVLSGCTITGNYVNGNGKGPTTEGDGGGVYSEDDDLTMTDCTVSGNSGNDAGYGLYFTGGAGKRIDLHNCTISSNVFVTDNSFTGYSTPYQDYGGAIFNAGAMLSLTNCTISLNSTATGTTTIGAAGGIYNAGALTLTDCTLTDNLPEGLTNAVGGTAKVTSTILAGNRSGTSGAESDISTAKAGAVTSGGSNLIGDPNGNGFVNDPHHSDPNSTGNHDQTGVTMPGLIALAANGGLTQTVALAAGSPAIDGDFADATPTDQRGAARPFGVRNDIGAFEYGATAPAKLVDTYLVTNINDNGAGSLRRAISNANTDPGAIVAFDPSVFGPGKPQTILLTSGVLAIAQSMTITGPGANWLSISGGNVSSVIATVGVGTVNITGLTITDGNSGPSSSPNILSGGGGVYAGEGTFNQSAGVTLNMTDCVISHCTAPAQNSEGGGLFNLDDVVNLTRCVITGNSAPNGSGGGIYNLYGQMTLTDCTVSGNSATNGGGIADVVAFTLFIVKTSTISGNTAVSGGGVYDPGFIILNLSTVANNTATAGGGFYTISGSVLDLYACTVTGNTAKTGGGLDNTTTDSSVLVFTILAGNTGGNIASTAASTILSAGYNLIGDPNGNGFTNGVNHDQTGVTNPKLGLLQDNGGPTQTIALLPGSPAIDAIPKSAMASNGAVPSGTDQRGQSRPQGAGFDIGSYEFGSPVAQDDAYSVQENKSLTVQAPGVLANDSADGSHSTLTATLVDSPTHGSLMFNHDGSFSYTPNTDFLGTDTFTYTIADGSVVGTTGTVTLTVANITSPTTTATINPSSPNGLNGYYTVPVTITLKAKAAAGDTSVVTTFYSLDGAAQKTYTAPIKVTADGTHTLTYFSQSTQGGTESTQTGTFAIDATAPVTTATKSAVTGGTQITLSAKDNLSGVASTVYTIDSGAQQTYSTPFTVTSTTAHTVVYHSTDKAGNVEKAQTITVASGVAHTFASGLQMFSVPADYSNLSLIQTLVQSGSASSPNLAVWVPTMLNYVLSPTAPADHLRPGQGYWVNLNGTGSLSSMGTPTPTSAPFSITLGEGWNMIGDPFNSTISLANVLVTAGGKSYTGIASASSAGVIGYLIYSYPAGSSEYVQENGTGSLSPYLGYWVYAFQPCTLTITAP